MTSISKILWRNRNRRVVHDDLPSSINKVTEQASLGNRYIQYVNVQYQIVSLTSPTKSQ